MNKEPITLMVIPHTGKVYNVKIPLIYVYVLGSIISFFLISSLYFMYDYTVLRGKITNLKPLNDELSKKIKLLEEDKVSQESELKNLNKTLVQLKKLDNKIRIMTGLEIRKDGEKKSIGGQGGPVGQDDSIEIKEKMYSTPFDSKQLPSGTNQYQQTLREFILLKRDFQVLNDYLEEQEDQLRYTPSIWPVKGWVISEYGKRLSLFTGGEENHEGIDISAILGTPVKATADGVVEFAGEKRQYGKVIIIEHSYGFKTFYGHNDEIKVRNGQSIKRGQIIATLGNTGKSIRPHLHYEVLVKADKENPRKYLID